MIGWPAGWRRIHHERLDSTNAEAARLASAGAALPFWLTADIQTAARGRRGRAWSAPQGNFSGSAALWVGPEAGQAALRSFTAALALAEALQDLGVPASELSLKWPNDVLWRGRKLAGILLESTRVRDRLLLVVGIGVNLAEAPPAEVLEPTAHAPAALAPAHRISPAELMPALADHFARWDRVLDTHGFAPAREAWLARAARIGQQVTARLSGATVSGRMITVDDSRAIVLDTATGRRHLPAADIFF